MRLRLLIPHQEGPRSRGPSFRPGGPAPSRRRRLVDSRGRGWPVTLASMPASSTAAVRVASRRQSQIWPFAAGALIGILGGLIGLGGAEFRLPLLMSLFGFAALQAVILNKAMSLVVVIAALPARAFAVPWAHIADHWWIVVNLLAGSMIGAWAAAGWATRMHSRTLHRTLALLLVAIAAVLAGTHFAELGALDLQPWPRAVAGVTAGVLIGMVAAFMGVAGGELLIPTIVLLFGADIRLAGSLSLLVSLPTMLVAFARYSRDATFVVIQDNLRFVTLMGAGSIAGAAAGGALLRYLTGPALITALVLILLVSAGKVWRHYEDA